MSLSVGDKLGPYEILGPIGAGGMGEVYRAHDTRLRREVAIKVSAERFSERFEKEARAIGVGGWVRNTDDGAVEVMATGNGDQLGRLRKALAQGPRAARVDEVQEFEAEQDASETSFRIEGAW